LPTGCKKKKDTEKMKQFIEYKNRKCIETKNNFVSDLRKNSSSKLPVFYEYYWKGNELIWRAKKWLEHQKD